jgi:GTP-binding protein
LIDTGGLTNTKIPFQENIIQQVEFALTEANVILFVVSIKDGINHDDLYIAKKIKHLKKKIILVANKSESKNTIFEKNQLHNLGFSTFFLISAEHGIGIGDLLDTIIKDATMTNSLKILP